MAGVLAAVAFGGKESTTLRRWRGKVEEALAASGRELDPEDPVTVAIFTKLTLAAAQTADSEKLDLLVNALLNSGADGVDPDYLQEYFADLISRLGALHVRVFRAIRDHNDLQLDLPGLSPDSLIRALQRDGGSDPDPDSPLIIESVWNELTIEGLAESDSVASFENTDTPRGYQIHGSRRRGSDFCGTLPATQICPVLRRSPKSRLTGARP